MTRAGRLPCEIRAVWRMPSSFSAVWGTIPFTVSPSLSVSGLTCCPLPMMSMLKYCGSHTFSLTVVVSFPHYLIIGCLSLRKELTVSSEMSLWTPGYHLISLPYVIFSPLSAYVYPSPSVWSICPLLSQLSSSKTGITHFLGDHFYIKHILNGQ